MSRRIDIELTSARTDGSFTWRAAGAREPKGVVDGSLLPAGASTGTVLRAEAEFELDGITILSVTDPKGRSAKSGLLELIPSSTPFEAVTQQLAGRDRGERRDRGDRPRGDRPRGDRPGGDRPRGDRPRGDRPGGDRPRGDRPGGDRPGGDRPGGDRPSGDRTGADRRPPRDGDAAARRGPRPERRGRPNFTPPPELPQRPKAKRLKPGRAHRNSVLAELPEAQRPVAERALQGGIPAVRQAVVEQNSRLKAEGKEEIPASGLVSMAEQLLPKLRVAEWLDRADAAKADIDELDLRDLRSVVAAGDDPMVARDESTRALAEELKVALAAKQEKELTLWFGDIDAAIGVGRIIRALKLSSQPPKAGVRFPTELAKRLAESATASLTPDALTDRWSAVLEAAAFSPVRAQVLPTAPPPTVSDELRATVARLGPLLPQIATLFGVEVKQGGSSPKPLRPTKPAAKTGAKPAGKPAEKPTEKPAGKPAGKLIPPPPDQAADTTEPAPAEPATVVPAPVDSAPNEQLATELADEPDAVATPHLEHSTVAEIVESIEVEGAAVVDVAVAAPEELPTLETSPVEAESVEAESVEAESVESGPSEA
jgi:hypothetical protein